MAGTDPTSDPGRPISPTGNTEVAGAGSWSAHSWSLTDPTRRQLVLVSVAYLILCLPTAELSRALHFSSGFQALYLPAGLTFVYLLWAGKIGYPVAVAARLAVDVIVFGSDRNFEHVTAVIVLVTIPAIYLLAVTPMRAAKLGRSSTDLFTWRTVLPPIAAPVLAGTLVATLDLIEGAGFTDTWRRGLTFALGDALAIVLVGHATLAILLITQGRAHSQLRHLTAARRAEVVAQLAAAAGVPIMAAKLSHQTDQYAWALLAVGPILWVTARHGPLEAAGALVVTGTVFTGAAVTAYGSSDALLGAQATLYLALAATMFTVYRRRRTSSDRELDEHYQQRYQALLTSAGVPHLTFTVDGQRHLAHELSSGAVGPRAEELAAHLEANWAATGAAAVTSRADVPFLWDAPGPPPVTRLAVTLHPEPGPDGNIDRVLVFVTDRSAEMQAQLEIARARQVDPLTGLANRNALLTMLQVWRHQSRPVAVITADIDSFKDLNQAGGPEQGDLILTEVGRRVANVTADQVIVARSGDDEFTLVVELRAGRNPEQLADDLLRSLREPIRAGVDEIQVTASVGVAVTTPGAPLPSTSPGAQPGGVTPLDAYHHAVIALHYAEMTGRNRAAIYQPGQREEVGARRTRERLLRHALAHDELVVLYQPIFDTTDRAMVGVEALVRFLDARGELLSPSPYISVAEASGLDIPLGHQVLDKACAQVARWNRGRARRRPLHLHVNVTAHQLELPSFPDQVATLCDEHGLDPSHLVLELTETAAFADEPATQRTLAALRSAGVRIALDDFGTGFSTLSHLRQIEVDEIKIDRCFVQHLPDDPATLRVVKLLAQFATSFGLTVTAEGVETREQLDTVIALRIGQAQGFLLARPTDAEVLTAQLTELISVGGAEPS